MDRQDFIKAITHYGKRLLLMIRNNIWYIVWFLIYYTYSLALMSMIFREKAFVINLLLYVFLLLIAHFLGDIIFGVLEGVRPLETKREKEYLNPIFEEVYQEAKERYPALPKITLHIVDSLTVNAVAIGRSTIAVTQGAIETFTPEELKGVLAHEMSHVYYGDSKAVIINTLGNGIFTLFSFIIKLILKGLEYIAMKFESPILQAVFSFIRLIFGLWLFSILWAGSLILSLNSRGSELIADRFAYEVGYGEQLTEALYIIQKMSLGQRMKLVAKLQASHPRVSKRIGMLEDLADEEVEIE